MTHAATSVWLVGLSGAGKTTVGEILARRTGRKFVDLDQRIERAEGRSVREMFATGGETEFRHAEARASRDLLGAPGLVVATGGGWMARSDIPKTAAGCVRVWLRVSPQTAAARIEGAENGRPLLDGGSAADRLTELLEARASAYAEAEWAVDTDGRDPDDVVDEVVAAIG